ncbi:MAG TPA: hypothetical protein VNX68_02050, partial [Nitrosopumilaceae archaeon]|nr:hypothetical protein [Nitrosopumilaceae archaeon]
MIQRLAAFILILFICPFSAYPHDGNKPWEIKTGIRKSFIENKGQFNNSPAKQPVLYAYDNGSTMIYFTTKGVTYSFVKRWKKEEKESRDENSEGREGNEKEERRMEFKTDVIHQNWENANTDVEIIPGDPTNDYHSYYFKDQSGNGRNENFIKGFGKLTYKNIYPFIDIEYDFHPIDGLKYILILHPGADISKVKMNYSEAIKLNDNGDIHIQTLFGDIIDHAPSTYYDDSRSRIISSRFKKTGKQISFQLGDYDHSKLIIIDPWTQTPALPNSNCVWECEKDGAGNAYIIGGDSP